MSDKPVAMYREKCADGNRCLHGCHTNEPCHTRPQPKAEQDEPIAFVTGVFGGRFVVKPTNSAMVLPVNIALYTHPQPRTWVGLTPTDMQKLSAEWWTPNENEVVLINWIEAKLKEKNNG